MKHVTDNIYIGDYSDAINIPEKVGAVVNCCRDHFEYEKELSTLRLEMDTWSKITPHMVEKVEKFVKHHPGPILFHCVGGIQRSPAVIISYLMKSEGWDYKTAVDFVESKTYQIFPTISTKESLIDLEFKGGIGVVGGMSLIAILLILATLGLFFLICYITI